MLAAVQRPVFRAELAQQRVDNFKHIHTVEAGIQSLIAFIVGGRMQHGIIHQPVVIPMQHFSDEKEIRL